MLRDKIEKTLRKLIKISNQKNKDQIREKKWKKMIRDEIIKTINFKINTNYNQIIEGQN